MLLIHENNIKLCDEMKSSRFAYIQQAGVYVLMKNVLSDKDTTKQTSFMIKHLL